MTFMVTWSTAPENMKATINRFAEGDNTPEGIKQIGRWHEVGTGRGFRVIEAPDLVTVTKTTLLWSDLMDIEIVPVVNDEELGRALEG